MREMRLPVEPEQEKSSR